MFVMIHGPMWGEIIKSTNYFFFIKKKSLQPLYILNLFRNDQSLCFSFNLNIVQIPECTDEQILTIVVIFISFVFRCHGMWLDYYQPFQTVM